MFGELPLPADLPTHEARAAMVRPTDEPHGPLYRHESFKAIYQQSPVPPHEPDENAGDDAIVAWQQPTIFGDAYVLRMMQSCYQYIVHYFGPKQPESGGILIGPQDDDDFVTHFVPDRSGVGTPVTFHLDGDYLTEQLRRFQAARMNCKGIIHSHPPGVLSPSAGDIEYVRRLFGNAKNDAASYIYLPIVIRRQLYPYVVDRDGHISIPHLVLV